MNYYDKEFRQNLLDLLNNYRKILIQLESESDKTKVIFLSDSISKVDRACQIIKPGLFDFLDEKRMKKVQESEYCKELIEEARREVRDECEKEAEKSLREKIEAELRVKLTAKIKEELQEERAKRKAKKKAKKQAENMDEILEKIKTALAVETQKNPLTPQTTLSKTEQKVEEKENDEYWSEDDMPEPPDMI